MKSVVSFFLERSLLVNLFTLAVLLLGSLFIYSLQKEVFPNVDLGIIKISTSYLGASSEDIEKSVTMEIERRLKGVEGIKNINALSLSGRSIIIIEVDEDYELDDVYDEVRSSVESSDYLPDSADTPVVKSFDNKQQGIIQVVLTGDRYNEIKDTAKRLQEVLERGGDISKVTMGGYLEDEISIEVDPSKLNLYQVTAKDIISAVRERNLNLSAGNFESPSGTLVIRTISEFVTLDDIRNVVLRSNDSGERIKISDVGNVVRRTTDSEIKQRSNGKKAVFLSVNIKESADILKSTAKLKSVVADFFENEKKLGAGVGHHYANDMSYWVKRRLNTMIDNGAMGLMLVFVCLIAFLNFRLSAVVSIGAPIAFMMAFIMMDVLGITINLISMFSLIMVLGMLVDDAIIVAEYYYQRLEQGDRPKEAAMRAACDTIAPVTATIVTTMVAFGSFFFMGGTMGKFIWAIPAVVIVCLAASLFECYLILPSHLMDFVRFNKRHSSKPPWYNWMLQLYSKSLKFALKSPWLVMVAFVFIFISSLLVAKSMRVELFPGDDVRMVYMQIKGDLDRTLDHTDAVIRQMERITSEELSEKELDQMTAMVGRLIEVRRTKTGHHYGSLLIYLTPPNDRDRSTDEILDHLAKKFDPVLDGYVLTSRKMKGGPPTGKPVDIEISGDDLGKILEISKILEGELKSIKGVTTTEIDYEEGKQQVAISVKEDEARRLGVSTRDIAWELRHIFSKDSITYIREQGEDIDIKLAIDDRSRSRIETLDLLYIRNRQGRRVPLSKLIDVEKRPISFVIRRKNRQRVISVTANINTEVVTPVGIAKNLTPFVGELARQYPSVHIKFGGENEDTNQSMVDLVKSFAMALVFIFLILVVMFGSVLQSLVVMAAIPLGLVGVIFTFKIASKSLSFMALLGVVALVGVVVNDSIVLVNFINKARKKGEVLLQTVHSASLTRFRPVLLTTVTTAAGLIFLAHPTIARLASFGLNKDSDPFLQPMAMSFAWGLIFSSVITLIFIPCAYVVSERLSAFFRRIFTRGTPRETPSA